MMEYKGYVGRVEFDPDAALFHGEVVNTRDVITFQGRSVDELKLALQESVEDYLAFCEERGEDPDKPFSGQFLARLTPELHRQVNLAAARSGISLNSWVSQALESAVVQSGVSTKSGGSRRQPARMKRARKVLRSAAPGRSRKRR
jgi:predicted HicB family RNase H-like nuclease